MNTILGAVIATIENEFEITDAGRAWSEKADEFGDRLAATGMGIRESDVGRFAWEALHEMARHAFMAGWRMRANPDELINLTRAD